MSRHWNPRVVQGGRPKARPRRDRRYRAAPQGGGWGQLRLMALGGLFLSAVYVSIPSGEVQLPGGGTKVADPWAVSVTDGDTFRYAGEKIRVADIDTPEVRGRCAEEEALAARATERMSELLRAGPFELHPIAGRDEDRYGRKLRIVTRDGRSLGDQLVAEGLARTWTGRREPWC